MTNFQKTSAINFFKTILQFFMSDFLHSRYAKRRRICDICLGPTAIFPGTGNFEFDQKISRTGIFPGTGDLEFERKNFLYCNFLTYCDTMGAKKETFQNESMILKHAGCMFKILKMIIVILKICT